MLCHFACGTFLGLFPAMLVFSAIMFAPSAAYWDAIVLLLLIFCLPTGLLFVGLGAMGQGKIIAGLFRWFGRRID